MRSILVRCSLLTLVAAAAGASTGYFARLDLPDVRSLAEYRPPTMSRMFDRDGAEIATFATEKRIVLDAGQIPASFRSALIASEDARFLSHTGIDVRGILRSVLVDLKEGWGSQGASTLTMQLAGGLFLDRSQKTVVRKLQEAFLALQIEREYSKEEIFTLYTNHVHMGHGLHGLGAAARYYFGKPARELTLAESAVLVGLLPRPASYTPFRDAELARRRRNLVLRRMVETGAVSADAAAAAAREPLVLAEPQEPDEAASYFVEEVRRALLEERGSATLYGGGLSIETTLEPRLQQIAQEAVRQGITAHGDRHGGDSEGAHAQAALVAIDPASGEVLALVGGSDFRESPFNRATQARRQPGSAFKPLVFAAAFENGRTPADVLLDEPTVFLDPRRPVPYQPENFGRSYYGAITLRTALEKSANIVAVKLLQEVGYEPTLTLARRLGISTRLRPYPSLALGAFEVNLLELTAAYGAFANQGIWVEPHLLRGVGDRRGRELQRTQPRVVDAVSPEVAFLMNHVLSGVIDHGTGKDAASLGRTLAGKTGTTDDYTDAWFVGYAPGLAVGVWVGYDERRSLGSGETGARAALPIWKTFMERALAGRPERRFPVPAGVSFATLDRDTGLLAHGDCGEALVEAFLASTEPVAHCGATQHHRLVLPYPFQRFPVDRDGNLSIPRDEFERLMTEETEVVWLADRGAIEYGPPGSRVAVDVRIRPPEPGPDDPRELPEPFRSEGFHGTDGRPAVVWWTRP